MPGQEIRLKIILAVFILIITFSSGCISDYSSENNQNKDYIPNDSTNTLDNTNYSPNSTSSDFNNHSSESNVPSQYEKKGYCYYVVDGDTIDVEDVGRIRLVGVNTPERGQVGYQEAKDFVKSYCLGKTVYLDVDNAKNYDKYGRTLAVVYVGKTNLNAILLEKGYAEVMYIPPSEFNPYSWT